MQGLRQLRKSKGLRQVDLMRKSSVSQGHISRLENGLQTPGPKTLQKLAWALDVDPAEMFEDPADTDRPAA